MYGKNLAKNAEQDLKFNKLKKSHLSTQSRTISKRILGPGCVHLHYCHILKNSPIVYFK